VLSELGGEGGLPLKKDSLPLPLHFLVDKELDASSVDLSLLPFDKTPSGEQETLAKMTGKNIQARALSIVFHADYPT
jgi:hypothetical protein